MYRHEIAARAVAYCAVLREALDGREETPASVESSSNHEPPESVIDDLILQASRVHPVTPEAIAVGQVWTVSPGKQRGAGVLVVLTHVEPSEICRAVLATEEPWLAGDDDVIVDGPASPTGYALVLHLWLDVPVARPSLCRFVGELTRTTMAAVLMLLQDQLTGGFRRDLVGTVAGSEVVGADESLEVALRWHVTSPRGGSIEFLSGAPIRDQDDPRIETRLLLRSATQYVEAEAFETETAAEGTETEPFWRRCARQFGKAIEDMLGLSAPVTFPGGATAGLIGSAPAALGWLVMLPAVGAAVRATRGIDGDREVRNFIVQVGPVDAELGVTFTPDDVTVSMVAVERATTLPVHGVRVTFRLDREEEEPDVLERETGPDGVIAGVRQPISEDGSYLVEVSYHGEQRAVAW